MKLVLLHGFTGDATSWDEVRDRLDPTRSVLVPALLGHGASDPITSFEAEVDRLARLILDAGFGGAHLSGYSLGARLGLGMLVRHPRLFARATLIGVHPGLEQEREQRRRSDERWIEVLETDGIESFTAAWESQALFATQNGEQREAERARRLRKDPRELARAMRILGLAAMPSYWSSLSSLGLPVQLMVGDADVKFGAIAEQMRTLLPEGSLVRVAGCGHNLPLEHPQAVAEAI